LNRRCRDHFVQPAAALLAFRQWLVVDLLKCLSVRVALLALILINRHESVLTPFVVAALDYTGRALQRAIKAPSKVVSYIYILLCASAFKRRRNRLRRDTAQLLHKPKRQPGGFGLPFWFLGRNEHQS
jgi:hypothetical protein